MYDFTCLNKIRWDVLKNNKSNIAYTKLDLMPFDIVIAYINKQYNGKYSCHLNCENIENKSFWKFNINNTLMSVYMNVETFEEAKQIIMNRLNELLKNLIQKEE